MNTRENHTNHVNHSNYSAKAKHKATKTKSNLMEPTLDTGETQPKANEPKKNP